LKVFPWTEEGAMGVEGGKEGNGRKINNLI
jgi:hypothetical protein